MDKNHPTPDEAAQAARPREIDQALNDKLKPSVQVFVSLFAAGPGQPQQSFQATVDQALFLANGGASALLAGTGRRQSHRSRSSS